MVATGFQGMVYKTPRIKKMAECYLCPGTFVTYVSGLYMQAKEVTRRSGETGN
jgi:hypothetical protein